MPRVQPLDELIIPFLADLACANCSHHTRYAYTTDLAQLCAFYQGSITGITREMLRNFFVTHLHLNPARDRKQAAVACFLTWVYRNDRSSHPAGSLLDDQS